MIIWLELKQQGDPALVNMNNVKFMRPYGKKTSIYFSAHTTDFVIVDEDFKEIKERLRKAIE